MVVAKGTRQWEAAGMGCLGGSDPAPDLRQQPDPFPALSIPVPRWGGPERTASSPPSAHLSQPASGTFFLLFHSKLKPPALIRLAGWTSLSTEE